MVEGRNRQVLSLVHAPRGLKQTIELSKLQGSLHTRKQQVNARKSEVRGWQLGTRAAAGDGVIGFRLIDENEVFDRQIDDADRAHDQHNG
jgi:hypothetical protein